MRKLPQRLMRTLISAIIRLSFLCINTINTVKAYSLQERNFLAPILLEIVSQRAYKLQHRNRASNILASHAYFPFHPPHHPRRPLAVRDVRRSIVGAGMTDTLEKALAAIHDWHAKEEKHAALPDLRMGDRVVEIGGDGSILYIAKFESDRRGEWNARCLKLGTDEVITLSVHAVKIANEPTIH